MLTNCDSSAIKHDCYHVFYPPNHYVSQLLTQGRCAVVSPDQPGFEKFLDACVQIKAEYDCEITWYSWDNIEIRAVYDWDHVIDYYFADLKQDQFFMADAYLHHVLTRNGIKSHRIMPVLELLNLLDAATGRMCIPKVNKHFTSLVNNPSDARYCVHEYLLDNGLLDHCHWSWNNGQYTSVFWNHNRWMGLRQGQYRQFAEHRQSGATYEDDMGIQELEHHQVSAVTLCYQTIYHGSGPVYDGTVFKCFLAMRPFLLVGSSGTLADLRDQGFRTFDGLIDESYDREVDPFQRMRMILAEIDRLAAIPLTTLIQQLVDYTDVFQHNYTRCMQIKAALDRRNLDALLMPPCRHLADYDNLLSPSQLRF